jgi:hypothetical protein
MKNFLSTLVLLSILFTSCERNTVIIVEDECETCKGATINLIPQTSLASREATASRTPVNREAMYTWIDIITIVAEDDQGVNYGDSFELVDDNSGADGFFLEEVPTDEIIDFSASSTSKDDGAGKFLQSTGNPDDLSGFVGRMPYAEYATDQPVSQYVQNGDNTVQLQMNTDHGRLISSFQLDDDVQYNNPSNNNMPMYKLVVNRGSESAYATGPSGVVAYWNDDTSLSGGVQTFNIEIQNYQTGVVVYTRTISETIVASTSITNKYVVGLDFVDLSTVEVIFTWQPWTDSDGVDETTNCGTITTQTINGNWSLTQNTTLDAVDLVVNGGINLNGYALSVTCGSVTVNGDLNGGGQLTHCGNLNVTGNIQNNPVITQDCN